VTKLSNGVGTGENVLVSCFIIAITNFMIALLSLSMRVYLTIEELSSLRSQLEWWNTGMMQDWDNRNDIYFLPIIP
jgi:cell division protein FtsL